MNMRPFASLALLLALVTTGCLSPKGGTVAEKQTYAREMRDGALERLYADHSGARQEVEGAAGYAVFSNFSIHPGLLTFASGYGVAVDKAGKETHMKMMRLGIGPGLAIKGMNLLLVFASEEAYQGFVAGKGGAGAFAEAAFVFGDFGGGAAGTASFSDEIDACLTTHTGFALELTLAGARFWPNDDLN